MTVLEPLRVLASQADRFSGMLRVGTTTTWQQGMAGQHVRGREFTGELVKPAVTAIGSGLQH